MPLFLSLTVDLSLGDADAAESLLHGAGATGLEVREEGTRPMPGVRAPAAGEAILVAYFDDRRLAEQAGAEISRAFPGARTAVEEVEQRDWSESWKALVRAVEVGRLWVGPPWLAAQAPPGKERIVIEPKMAFGTGDHPTTSLCLLAVDAYLQAHPGATVLDVGTGTGVLAIAARRLGASRAVGIDNDPVSVELARENAAVNGTPEVELSGKSLEELPPGRFDLVVANILANTLVELAPAISRRAGDALVLAGVLVPQRQEVEAAFVRQGLEPVSAPEQGEWVRIDLRRPRGT